jgi:hypothetical protein
MQLSSILIGAFALTASAVPTTSVLEKRGYTYYSTVSDDGFYAAVNPPDYQENQILYWTSPPAGETASLVARFPAGFAVTLSGPAKIDVYSRTSAGTGAYLGTAGTIPVSGGVVTEDYYVEVFDFVSDGIMTVEFILDSDEENASVAFFWTDEAGFFLRTGSS